MNKLTIKLRSVARNFGLTKFIHKALPKNDYEERFDSALLDAINEGDTVWDIGANVGYYTQKIATLVGENGRVFAMEPSPDAARTIEQFALGSPSVTVVRSAVSNQLGEACFDISGGGESMTNHLTAKASGGNQTVSVQVTTGDELAKNLGVPNIIKIDVEGFEHEVLEGMPSLLKESALRGVFCEVHFAILEARGRSESPIWIERTLRDAGLKVQWVDSSHIVGSR